MKIIMTFIRANPPTKAHVKLLEYMEDYIDSIKPEELYYHYVFLSPSVDHKKNPLTPEFRLKYLRKLFPNLHFNVTEKNPFSALCNLGKCGKNIIDEIDIITGPDRVKRYREFSKYINHQDPKKRIPFIQKINVISFGKRDSESKNLIESCSGTKARKWAVEGKYVKFMRMVPGSLVDRVHLYREVRRGLL